MDPLDPPEMPAKKDQKARRATTEILAKEALERKDHPVLQEQLELQAPSALHLLTDHLDQRVHQVSFLIKKIKIDFQFFHGLKVNLGLLALQETTVQLDLLALQEHLEYLRNSAHVLLAVVMGLELEPGLEQLESALELLEPALAQLEPALEQLEPVLEQLEPVLEPPLQQLEQLELVQELLDQLEQLEQQYQLHPAL